jgi:hypothetical protein
MDIGKSISFVMEDERWVGKIGIGALVALLSFLIIPIPLLVGYAVGITRNVKNGDPTPLPEWEDWGQLFKDGLSIIVAQIVYTLPFWLLMCIVGIGTVGFGSLSEISEEAMAAGMVTTFGLVGCLAILFLIAVFFLSPAIVVQYVRTDELGSTFRFGEVLGIARDNIGNILIVFLVTLGLNFAVSLVVGVFNIIPIAGQCIGLIIAIAAGPYLMAVTGHLYGQIAASS